MSSWGVLDRSHHARIPHHVLGSRHFSMRNQAVRGHMLMKIVRKAGSDASCLSVLLVGVFSSWDVLDRPHHARIPHHVLGSRHFSTPRVGWHGTQSQGLRDRAGVVSRSDVARSGSVKTLNEGCVGDLAQWLPVCEV